MKILRNISLFGVVLSVCLASVSCGKANSCAKPVEIEENLSLSAQIKSEDYVTTAELKRGGNCWECTFDSPDSIKGMKVTLSGDVCKIDYSNLSYELDRKNLPQASCVSLITKAVDRLVLQKDLSCEFSEDKKTVTEKGTVNGSDFSAKIKNKKISAIDFGDFLSVKFK